MSRLYTLAALCAAALALAASPALADPGTPSNPKGRILGVVPVHSQAGKLHSAGGNLSYHNGPVMRTNKTYAVYWFPTGSVYSGTYQSLINGFFGNVATASGATSNVYYSDTQYYDTTGSISYSSTFGGSYLDTSAFPANGCSDSYTTICLSDAQLQSELQTDIGRAGWSANSSSAFFILTPKGVGSCVGGSCAFSQYCAYHSNFTASNGANVLYANMPYTDTVPAACDSGQYPNGDAAADSTINVISHEHNESITDPFGSAWFDNRGYENGDKCAWNFGSATGSTSSGQYNQTINGAHYYLQQEWSNHSSRCVLTGT